MKIAVLIARILLGLVFLVFGLNNLHPFIPCSRCREMRGPMATIMFVHGWIVFHGVLYVIAGVILLAGRYVPVALVILGPILVNILVFHFTLAPAGYTRD